MRVGYIIALARPNVGYLCRGNLFFQAAPVATVKAERSCCG